MTNKLKTKLFNCSKALIDISKALYEYDTKVSNILLTIARDLLTDCEKLEDENSNVEVSASRSNNDECKCTNNEEVQTVSSSKDQKDVNIDLDNVETIIKQYIDDVKKELGIE